MFLRKIIYLFLLVIILNLTGCNISQTNEKVLSVGVLLDLTGGWSSLGTDSQITLDIAKKDINNYFKQLDVDTTIKLVIEDTAGNPQKALEKLTEFHKQGVTFVIGPQSSDEVKHIKEYADNNDIIIISQGSTAHDLAIKNDNIFRYVTDDLHEGKAISKLMWKNGIRTVIPLHRDDAGNNALLKSINLHFLSLGNNATVLEAEKYSTTTTDFTEQLTALNHKIDKAFGIQEPETIAIYFAGFDEAIELFKQAQQYYNLSKIKWYGSNGMALNKGIIEDNKASEFAILVEYNCPINAEIDSKEYKQITSRVQEKIKHKPDPYSLAAYDALWVVAQSYLITEPSGLFNELKENFVNTSNKYIGATGSTTLNAGGDRNSWDYEFWTIKKIGGRYMWEKK